VLVLGKPLGIGVLSAALKKGILDEQGYAEMVGVTTQLNRVGRTLAALPAVHAMTDVTGFGLAGHLAEICRGSGVGADVGFGALPVIGSARPLLERGIGPGAIERNWASCSSEVEIDPALPSWAWRLLCDPQTSGGLLVSCAPAAADTVLAKFASEGFSSATRVGIVRAGAENPRIRVA
jgi:selenide,water dikinase